MNVNDYKNQLSDKEVSLCQHREFVGGLWDEVGELQFDFMVTKGGLRPDMSFLDLGCGCFRGGVHFIPFLLKGNYYGLDVNASLIKAGLDVELPNAGLELSINNLLINDVFDAESFGVKFDRVLAVSVWTHLPLNHIQRCMAAVSRVLVSKGVFFTSIFECPRTEDLLSVCVQKPGGISTFRDRDPYHYKVDDFYYLLRQLDLPLKMEVVGEWGHPRNQKMLAFRRV